MHEDDLAHALAPATIADSQGVLALAKLARGPWSATTRHALDLIDPSGLHVLATKLSHNDREWRTCWLIKLAGSDEPATVWLDLPMDGCIAQHTGVVEFG